MFIECNDEHRISPVWTARIGDVRLYSRTVAQRDATANTLDVAVDLATPRLTAEQAPTTLPDPAPDSAAAVVTDPNAIFAADPRAPLSANQKTMAALALACDLQITDPKYHAALYGNHQQLIEQKDAADYIQNVAQKVKTRRKNGFTE